MPDLSGVPIWIWVVAGSIVGLALVAVVVWLTFGQRAVVRRYLVVLVGRRESIRASLRTLEAIMRHLVDESDESLAEFATDHTSADRRALMEVGDRMRMILDELDTRSLPSRLIRPAEELADAAYVIAQEAGRVTDDMAPDRVLEALGEVDLARVTAQMREADEWLDDACQEYGVEDAAVYGGGLYI